MPRKIGPKRIRSKSKSDPELSGKEKFYWFLKIITAVVALLKASKDLWGK